MPETGSLQPMSGAERRRGTIVFADLVESVRLMQRHEADAIDRWRRFAAQVREHLLPTWGGRMVRTAGDGLLMEFERTPSALAAVFDLHDCMDASNHGRDAPDVMALRVGIHVAEITFDQYEAYGTGVNLAARLSTLAQPGQTLISVAARDEVVDGLHARLHDLGLRFVKHLDEPVRAFRADRVGSTGTAGPRLQLPSQDDLRPAVAVVPFSLLPAQGVPDALGHAMADDVIAALSRHAGLRVLSRASTSALQGGLPELPRLRQLLGVSFLLTGHYYRHGTRVRLNVELCELAGGHVLWAGHAMAEVDAIFAGQDELVPHIVANVSQRVLACELSRVRSLPMDTLASYTLYLGATGLMNSLVLADFKQARVLLEHLVDRHPRQAAPYAMLARWHVFSTVQGWAHDRRQTSLAAREQAQRAIDIDPQQAVALVADGMARMNFENDVEGARGRYLAALQADPQEAYAWASLSAVHSLAGEHDAACAASARSLALSPLDPNLFVFESYAALATLGAGRYGEAVGHAQSSLRHHAMHAPSYRLLIAALWLEGRSSDARAATARYLALQPDAKVGPFWRSAQGAVFSDALMAAGVPP